LDWSAVWQEIRAGLAAMLRQRWLEAVYRFFSNQRWTIEEYLKAIKTGCEFEKRQLQDVAEVAGDNFSDPRLNKRLVGLVGGLARNPSGACRDASTALAGGGVPLLLQSALDDRGVPQGHQDRLRIRETTAARRG
jgi:hypothetical protein